MSKRLVELLGAAVFLLASVSDGLCQVPTAPTPPTPAALAAVLIPRAYVQAGVELAVHPTPSSLRDYSAVHGSAPAALLTGGVRLAPAVGLELEVGIERPTATPLRLESPTFRTFGGEVRDAALGANVRWHPGRKYHIEMVLGGGLVHSRYARRSEVISDPFGGGPTISVADTEVTATQASVGGGISIPISVGATVAVVPTISYRWVKRPFYSDAARLSVARHVFRVGVAVRRHARRAAPTRSRLSAR
jgi:hypothetical protein